MVWPQNYDPFGIPLLSILFAILPLIGLLYFLAVRHMKGLYACGISLTIALILALFVWKMPPLLTLAAVTNGMAFGLFPIGWIILHAMWFYNMNVDSGQFDHIRNFLSTLTADRRLQAVLIAFVLGAFLEGAAGFGTPVAISAAILISLGFKPLTAAVVALISNTAPVAFGGLGLTSAVAAQVTGNDLFAIGRSAGLAVSLLGTITPFVISVVLAGFKRGLEILPILLGVGLFFSSIQYFIATFINPYLPMFFSAAVTLVTFGAFLKFWKPKSLFLFPGEIENTEKEPTSSFHVLRASVPFILLTVIVFFWADLQYSGFKVYLLQWEKSLFNPEILWPELHEKVLRTPPAVVLSTVYPARYIANFISTPGTAILLTGLLSIFIMPGYSLKKAFQCYLRTLHQLRFALATLPLVLALAYLMNYSGMSISIGLAFNAVGPLFPFFSPLIGYIGVFLTGSETSSNALFGLLQQTNADSLGFSSPQMLANNMIGGGAAKMITPQTIAVATAATHLGGQEGKILEQTWKVSLLYLIFVSLWAGAIAYLT